MTFNPPLDSQDIRIRFSPEAEAWIIEQQAVRFTNGSTDVHDVAAMLDPGSERWEERFRNTDFFTVAVQSMILADDENVRIQSVQLDPLTSQSGSVIVTKNYLELHTI